MKLLQYRAFRPKKKLSLTVVARVPYPLGHDEATLTYFGALLDVPACHGPAATPAIRGALLRLHRAEHVLEIRGRGV